MPNEGAILELANVARQQLNSLEGRLHRSTRRSDCKAESEAKRPQNPSVVDEIIDLMLENNKRLADLSEQIQTEVLIKLGETDIPKP